MKSSKSSKFFSRRLSVLLVIGILLSGMTAIGLSVKQGQDIRSQAEDVPFCQDKCIGQDRCGNGPPGDPNYNDPCCVTLKQTGDPFACPWPQRGYCTDDQCNAIPAGVDRQRCGGPRHEWCNLCRQNNCPGYGTSPTNPPNPTRKPKPSPTRKPSVPTRRPTNVLPSPTQMPATTTRPSPTKYTQRLPTAAENLPTSPPSYTGDNAIASPSPASVGSNPVFSVVSTLQNFLFSFISSLNPNLSSPSPTQIPTTYPTKPPVKVNILGDILRNISEFTQKVAP